jgi:hypothetical protein
MTVLTVTSLDQHIPCHLFDNFKHNYSGQLSYLAQICIYTGNNTCIRSSDPKGFLPSFKTLDLVVDQSLAANLRQSQHIG